MRPVSLIVAVCLSLLAGCDAPVRVGIEQARAAGMNVGYTPFTTGSSFATGSSAVVRPARVTAGQLLFLPAVPEPHSAADVVGLKLEPIDHRDEAKPRPVTFGEVFVPGQLPRGSGLAARVDGHEVPAQLDAQTSNPDGSVRFGIVTLDATAPADVMLVRRPPAAGVPVDLTALAGYDLTVDLILHEPSGDVARHFSAARLLADALRGGKPRYWLRGPLASEIRVSVAVEGSLRLTFDIRGYADGSSFTDVQFNNDIAMQPVGGTASYDVSIGLHGKPVLQHAGIQQFQYQTWHHEVWSDGDPGINVVHDAAAMERSGAVWHYDLKHGVAAAALASEENESASPGYGGILSNAAITKYMPMSGGRRDIGPLPVWDGLWLVTQNAEAARFALIQADAAGTIPWHSFDAASGNYMTLDNWPKLWTDGRGGNGPPGGLTQQVASQAGWALDPAHEPGLSYLAYLETGLRYYLDQLDAQASWNALNIWPGYRLDGQGIVASKGEQLRAAAWSLREIVEAAYISPDDDPLTAYFRKLVANNFDYLLAEAAAAPRVEPTGWLQGDYGNEKGGMAPWQQDYMASTVILAAQQGVGGARRLLTWQAHFLAGRFLAGDKGMPPYDGIAYNMIMWDVSPEQPYRTWAEVEAGIIAHHWTGGGTTWRHEALEDYETARGVLSGMVTVLDLPEAKQALAWLEAHPPDDYRASWQHWDIVTQTQ